MTTDAVIADTDRLADIWRQRAADARARSLDPAASLEERQVQIGLASAWASAAQEVASQEGCTVHENRTDSVIAEAEKLSLCDPECYGRCRICPADVLRDLLAVIAAQRQELDIQRADNARLIGELQTEANYRKRIASMLARIEEIEADNARLRAENEKQYKEMADIAVLLVGLGINSGGLIQDGVRELGVQYQKLQQGILYEQARNADKHRDIQLLRAEVEALEKHLGEVLDSPVRSLSEGVAKLELEVLAEYDRAEAAKATTDAAHAQMAELRKYVQHTSLCELSTGTFTPLPAGLQAWNPGQTCTCGLADQLAPPQQD